MKKTLRLICLAAIGVFSALSVCEAVTIVFEDFEDSSGFTLGGGYDHYWIYLGVAPLNGTEAVPSGFVQGGSQSGNIFYGSFAKPNAAGETGETSPTMRISLPDLTGYTNLALTVALAAPHGIWESSHRDSLYVEGETGLIDSFLPTASRSSSLRSQVYAIDLDHEFQDFVYAIDSNLKSLTFTFASTAGVEVVGIDSVMITGDALLCSDGDEDGFAVGGPDCGPFDCDDTDGAVYPGATELCDYKDNQCDGDVGYGLIDEDCELTLLSPENGTEHESCPTFSWQAGLSDEFYLILILPFSGHGYYRLVIPTAELSFQLPSWFWNSMLVSPDTYSAWLVVGVDTTAEPEAWELSEVRWFKRNLQ